MEPERVLRIATDDNSAERADLFLSEMIRDTGVSTAFAEAARPAIEKAFRDVEPSRRGAALDQARELFLLQAATERSCTTSLKAAKRIGESQRAMVENLTAAHRQMTEMRDRLIGTAFATCRLFDGQHPKVRA